MTKIIRRSMHQYYIQWFYRSIRHVSNHQSNDMNTKDGGRYNIFFCFVISNYALTCLTSRKICNFYDRLRTRCHNAKGCLLSINIFHLHIFKQSSLCLGLIDWLIDWLDRVLCRVGNISALRLGDMTAN